MNQNIIKNTETIFKSHDGDVFLEYMTIGNGPPKTFLISAIHGNEKTGQTIIKRLLSQPLDFIGTLTILSIANPTGYARNIRQEAISGLDLNRCFLDEEALSPVKEIVHNITDTAKSCEYVIDLHNFITDGLIQVVSNHISDADSLAMLFKPDVVRSPGKAESSKKIGTFNQYLKTSGIPYVLLELPTDSKVSEKQIDQIVSGLKEHLTLGGKYSSSNPAFNQLPKVKLQIVKAEATGLFIKNPHISLGDIISAGDILGEILINGKSSTVVAPFGGIVCELDLDEKRNVIIAQTLVGIGEYV